MIKNGRKENRTGGEKKLKFTDLCQICLNFLVRFGESFLMHVKVKGSL